MKFQEPLSTLPTCLCIKQSESSTRGEYTICSLEHIPVLTTFGPYGGAFIRSKGNKKRDFFSEVENELVVLDNLDGIESNWLLYVKFASKKEEGNLMVVQEKSGLYYITCKEIPANKELLVWHPAIICKEAEGSEIIFLQNIEGNTLKDTNVSTYTSDLNRTIPSPYKCNVCQKAFTGKATLKLHERVHTGEKPYECKTCSRRFSQISNLRRHNMMHSGKRPHICNVCQKAFYEKAKLKLHQTQHTGEKPYECKICSRKFADKARLNRHNVIHSGERLNKCDICQKVFFRKITLRYHRRVHTRENPMNVTPTVESSNTVIA